MKNAINIVKCVETVDNWGNVETYKGADLYKLLATSEDEWTDDQVFVDDSGKNYSIDDLLGKRVVVGTIEFTV